MPIAADPNATVEFSLMLDEAKPAESRPVFLLKFLTVRERLRVSQLLREAATDNADDAKANAALSEIITTGVKGRRHMDGLPTDPDDYLTIGEKWELAFAVANRPQVSEDDRKNSLRPQPAAAAQSAATPAAAPGDAPANTPPSTSGT